VAVVLSAMSGVTNKLVAFCQEAAPFHDMREYDAVVSTGEQVTVGLLAIILQSMGIPARSWAGWQVPIRTDDAHGRARIAEIATAALLAAIDADEVPVVAGFQGIGSDGRVTTLGRGGSDTSAVGGPPPCRPTAAPSIPTALGATPPIPASCRRRANCRASPMRKCWRWRPWAPRCSRPVRSKWR
jgi:hypothetical protein